MSDDDRTIDADDSMMDELRRLAEEARRANQTDDRTVAASGSTMEELRRFADEARQWADPLPRDSSDPVSPVGERTVDADDSAMETLREYAAEARRNSTPAAEPTVDVPPSGAALWEEPTWANRAPEVPDIPSDVAAAVPDSPVASGLRNIDVDPTIGRSDISRTQGQIAEPAVEGHTGGGWRPPPRMVMPVEPERHTHVHHGPWRMVSIVLAVVVVALVSFLAVGLLTGGDGEVPADDSGPDGTVSELDDGGGAGG